MIVLEAKTLDLGEILHSNVRLSLTRAIRRVERLVLPVPTCATLGRGHGPLVGFRFQTRGHQRVDCAINCPAAGDGASCRFPPKGTLSAAA
jgi:hypothetical protein